MNPSLNGYAHMLFTAATPTCKRNNLVISNVNYCGASQMPTLVAIHVTAQGITKWTGYALTAAIATPAELPEQCTKLRVKLMAATASILGNCNDT